MIGLEYAASASPDAFGTACPTGFIFLNTCVCVCPHVTASEAMIFQPLLNDPPMVRTKNFNDMRRCWEKTPLLPGGAIIINE